MKIKRVKKICDVAGCRNRDCFYISRAGGSGSVIICKDCLTEALDGIENYKEPKRKVMSEPPELFFGVLAPQEQNEEDKPQEQNVEDKPQEVEPGVENIATNDGDDKKKAEYADAQAEADNGENAADVKPKSKNRRSKAKAAKDEGEA